MLTFCYNTKQTAFILLKIKIVDHCVNTAVEHYSNVFVHKGGKLENRQFLAKMHQIAPNCVSNFKIFMGWHPGPHPWGGGHLETSPRSDSLPLATRWSPWQFHTPHETNGWIKPWLEQWDMIEWMKCKEWSTSNTKELRTHCRSLHYIHFSMTTHKQVQCTKIAWSSTIAHGRQPQNRQAFKHDRWYGIHGCQEEAVCLLDLETTHRQLLDNHLETLLVLTTDIT